eukprot:gene22315-28433_t
MNVEHEFEEENLIELIAVNPNLKYIDFRMESMTTNQILLALTTHCPHLIGFEGCHADDVTMPAVVDLLVTLFTNKDEFYFAISDHPEHHGKMTVSLNNTISVVGKQVNFDRMAWIERDLVNFFSKVKGFSLIQFAYQTEVEETVTM